MRFIYFVFGVIDYHCVYFTCILLWNKCYLDATRRTSTVNYIAVYRTIFCSLPSLAYKRWYFFSLLLLSVSLPFVGHLVVLAVRPAFAQGRFKTDTVPICLQS